MGEGESQFQHFANGSAAVFAVPAAGGPAPRRRRTVSDCVISGSSSSSSSFTTNRFNLHHPTLEPFVIPPPSPVRTLKRKKSATPADADSSSRHGGHEPRRTNFLLIASIFIAGFSIATFLFIAWNNDASSRKHVFLPQVEQLAASIDGELGDSIFEIDEDGECDGQNALGLELEAASAVHAALEMKEQGKLSKAQKLFHHAMVLCPKHADILNHYGEFFEETRNDYLMADHLYVQALTYAPRHTKALTNRKRTSPVVEEIDERRLQKIDEKLEILISIPDTNSALRRVKKEAYFQHLYHTVGIEGNTMSLAQTRLIIETRMAVGGKSIMEHNEILGLDDAMKFINTSLIHRIGAIALQDVLSIHFHVMSYVDPSEAGKFRRTQVYVGSHIPPGPNDIQEQMESLIEWLNSDEALSLHPIHYAAIAHYKLVHIHPFVDGNGRTSRLLMNFILMQAGYPPVIIRKQDRQLYYDHLNTANNGDIRPFIRFIADCTEKTVDVYLWASTEMGKYHILGPQQASQETEDAEAAATTTTTTKSTTTGDTIKND